MFKKIKESFNSIKKLFYNFFYYLPFGMKGAEEMITSPSINEDYGVIESVRQNRLSEGLIKGEVTQQVEEMRYRDYKIYRESRNYKYLGNGTAIKNIRRHNIGWYKFTQENKRLTNTVLEELNRVDVKEYSNDTFTLNVTYENMVRFPLEKYCKTFQFESPNSAYDNRCFITFNFYKFIDTNDVNTKHFISFLKDLVNKPNSISRQGDYVNNIKLLSFTTYKADEEDDFINYTCFDVNDGDIVEYDDKYVIRLTFKNFNRVDLTDKFYCKTMEEKYKNKEKKENTFSLGKVTRLTYCHECGREISNYDADITKETIGFPMCSECLEKYLEREYK